jgi:hypothetical protein
MEKLSNYEINGLCRNFYNYLNSKKFDNLETEIINKYGVDFLSETKNKSLISLILQYGICKDDKEIINKIFPFLSMTRDYLHYINYYKSDKLICQEIFIKFIKPELILPKDIEYLIENNLGYLIKNLDGKFISIDSEGSIPSEITLKKYDFVDKNNYIRNISSEIDEKVISKFYEIIKKDYKYIIDAGNILHSRNLEICKYSSNDLETVIKNYPESLIIIHRKHLNNNKIKIKDVIKDKNYFATPYSFNDDIFILLANLYKPSKIITNDFYKDHTIDCVLRNYLFDDIIKYKNKNGFFTFDEEIKYSRCIQNHNDNIYIPCSNNKGFLKVWI